MNNSDGVMGSDERGQAGDGANTASVVFGAEGQLHSTRFEDVYFSRQDGLAEARHVFVNRSDLAPRWQGRSDEFVLVELGFGTGLNFLATWQHWQREAGEHARLSYVGIERYPLPASVMSQALAQWPELAPLARQLLDHWPTATGGRHVIEFEGARLRLLLILDDVKAALEALPPASTDAWYLDGFAPARNPEMWSDAVLNGIGQASARQATLATFSAAGFLRRGLIDRGFQMHKRPGFAYKRENLMGRLGDEARTAQPQPWFHVGQPADPGSHVAVVGAGVAGTATALALSRRGVRVTLLEAGSAAGHGASGNPAGALYPLITADGNRQSQFSLMAFDVALRWLSHLEAEAEEPLFDPCGVMLLGFSDAVAARFEKAVKLPLYGGRGMQWLSAEQASERAGVSVPYPGLWLGQAGWVAAKRLCGAMQASLMAAGNDCLSMFRLDDMRRQGGRWHLFADDGRRLLADQVVISTGSERLTPLADVPFEPVRGAVSLVEANEQSRGLRCVLCHKGYVLPVDGSGCHLIGARYDRHCLPAGPGGEDWPALQTTDHTEHLALLNRHLPGLGIDGEAVRGGRGSWRMTTPDRMPVAGPLPDVATAKAEYAGLAKGPLYGAPLLAQQPGLWIHGGHGSRGLTHAMLCAEVIADAMAGRRVLMPEPLRQAIHPARFLLRDLKRKTRDS